MQFTMISNKNQPKKQKRNSMSFFAEKSYEKISFALYIPIGGAFWTKSEPF